jgi:TolB-like protein/Flp pilus assembly protein TadD
VVAVLVAVIGFALYPWGGSQSLDSIAVLPFDIRTNDPDGDYISDGITQSISNSLTRLPGLRVIPVSVGREYKGKGMTSQQVGEELGVAAVLTGRVTHRGDSIGVDVELADIHQGKLLWGERFNRPLADLLAIQDGIATEVSRRLTALSSSDQQRLRSGSTDNPQAYQLYLKGMYFTAKFTRDGFDRGRGFFQQALAIDSNYALAWDGLAWNYVTAADWFIPPREAGPQAKAAARRALSIDSTLASAHQTLGIVYHWYDWDFPAAERSFSRAVAMDSTNARPRDYYAWFLASMGRFDESIAQAQRAQQLDPVSVEASQMLGMMLVLARRYDQAITQLRAALELDPTYFYAEDFLGRAYEQTSRMPEAFTAYRKAVDLDSSNAENWSNLAHAYAVSGNPGRARQIINDLKATATRNYVGPYNIALIYAGLGDKDQAFAWLQRACDDGEALPILYMVNDARWDRLRSEPRYADVARCLRLPTPSPVAGRP